MTAPSRDALHVLVLDGQYCHALAAVRSLGRRGVRVDVASHKPRAQGFASKHCRARIASPDPNRNRGDYADWLLDTLQRGGYATVLAFEEATADILSEYAPKLREWTSCLQPQRDVFLQAARKDLAARTARQLGVLQPQTFEIETMEDLYDLVPKLDFPVVVKGIASSGSQQVAVAGTPAELGHEVRRIAGLRRDPGLPLPVVQEFVPGSGYGLTALMRHGEPVATFMHRRLAEHDIQQGVGLAHGATAAESVHEPQLLDAGLTLLRALGWDGMAMVEFKRHARTGQFYFIEINPRFVGSLELAIAAGVDFPWMYTQLAIDEPVTGPARYRVGLKYRWLISKNVADAFERPLGYLLGAFSGLRPDTRTDISFRDPLPHLHQLRNAAWWIRERLRKPQPAPARRVEPPADAVHPASERKTSH